MSVMDLHFQFRSTILENDRDKQQFIKENFAEHGSLVAKESLRDVT